MYANKAGEVAFTYECQHVRTKITLMHRQGQYCEELLILTQDIIVLCSIYEYDIATYKEQVYTKNLYRVVHAYKP